MDKNIWIFAPEMDLQIQIFKIDRPIQTFEKFTKIFECSRQKTYIKCTRTILLTFGAKIQIFDKLNENSKWDIFDSFQTILEFLVVQ